MYKTLKPIAFACLASLQFFSCQRDMIVAQRAVEMKSKSEVEQIVQQSRGWYESQPWAKESAKNLRAPGESVTKFVGAPVWQEPSFFKLTKNTAEFIRFPLHEYEVNVSYTQRMSKAGFRDLLMRKTDSGEFIVDIIEMHPDPEYIKKKKVQKNLNTDDLRLLVDNADYTGYFLVYSKENMLRYGERRENGAPVSRLSW